MLFNSLSFLLFFPLVTALYFLLPHKHRWLLLLTASCFFYMFFKPVYILILFFTIIIDYYAGIFIEKENDKKKRRNYLILSIIANVGVLAIFKYFNFLNSNIDGLASLIGFENPIPYLQILLPVGLSFHTFQAMSYTIEVYRKKQPAEKHIGIYALYVMYYPQLVAGPIERPQNVIHQFKEEHYFNYERTLDGLKLIAIGLLKKIVIADRLALCVDEVFNNVHYYKGGPLILGVLFFTFQIYCDFSGYSNIARGCSRIMGIELMKNFNAPYLSKSIKEFWSRWHISLSTWFRDYLYIPLGGNRRGKRRTYFNIFAIFLISGLWHGASWTFVIWGALHGTFNTLEIAIKKKFNLFKKPLFFLRYIFNFSSWAITFIIVAISWTFFRANNLDDAIYILNNIYKIDFNHLVSIPIFSHFYFISSLVFILFLFIFEFLYDRNIIKKSMLDKPVWAFTFFSITFILIYMFGVFENQSFIYFQF